MPGIQDASPAMGESLRRHMNQPPSGVGIPGQSGSSPSSQDSPIQQQGLNSMPNASSMMPGGGDTTSGARKAVENALPGEANMILKTLVKHLDRLNPDQSAQPIQ